MNALIVRPRQPIEDFLAPFPERWTRDGALVVGTHCLYPDGQNVSIELRPSIGGKWDVTDGGAGWDVLAASCMAISTRTASNRADRTKQQTGVAYEDGAWWLRNIAPDALAAAIMWVANASQDWVRRLMGERHRRDAATLEDLLRSRLEVRFGTSALDVLPEYQGASSKIYDFSAILHLHGRKTAIFQVVTPHGSSLYSAYTKMGDVLKADARPEFVEAVIEDAGSWPAADLALLRSVSTGVTDLSDGLTRRLERLAA